MLLDFTAAYKFKKLLGFVAVYKSKCTPFVSRFRLRGLGSFFPSGSLFTIGRFIFPLILSLKLF